MTVRVRFVTSHDPISWSIRFAEAGFLFSHVEIETRDGAGYLGAHADGGVESRPKGYDAKYNPIESIIELPAREEQAKACFDFLESQAGYPYDFEGIARMAGHDLWPSVESLVAEMQKPWSPPSAWFCSCLADDGLTIGKFLPALPFNSRTRSPRDLYMRVTSLVSAVPIPSYAKRPPAEAMQARPV